MKQALIFVGIILGVALVGYVAYQTVAPMYYFSLFPLFPLFFVALCVMTIVTFEVTKFLSENKLLVVYFASKIIKLLFCIVFVMLYLRKVQEHNLSFVVSFMGFFFAHLCAEIYYVLAFLKKE